MSDEPKKEDSLEDAKVKIFETICRYKDSEPSNLSEVFESYGLNTLEAKVPVVDDPIVDKLLHINPEQRFYATMALKTQSATMSVEGRHPRTRNRVLKMVDIGNETVLATGETRERSPVDIGELDDDLEQYRQERLRLKAMKDGNYDESSHMQLIESSARSSGIPQRSSSTKAPKKDNKFEGDQDELDKDLDAYMSEVGRKKAQKKSLVNHTEQMDIMMDMEDHMDDNLDENIEF